MTIANAFTPLCEDLIERATRATTSHLGPANPALLAHLTERLHRGPGADGSFLADPVLEGLFTWERHSSALGDVPFLRPELVTAMNEVPERYSDEYRFPRERRPYAHQFKAWSALSEREPRSVLIRTGTASGKTECFVVPVLNSLAAQLAADPCAVPLVGVQAILLYPLNALIASQRERLDAWTAHFKGRVRFALYNGLTREDIAAHEQDDRPNEVLSRKLIRSAPPPVLVTNATMLEYMLVRAIDAPLVEQSKGKLRWIVLDEAHTYLGSSAAELSLLLRRVMIAFNVTPDEVRFVATSATVGGDDADTQLRRFLSDVAGVSEERVVVVSGRRSMPALPAPYSTGAEPVPSREEIARLAGRIADPETLARLTSVAPLRSLRDRLCAGYIPLSETADLLFPGDPRPADQKARHALELVDLATQVDVPAQRDDDAQHLLRVRTHFFLRTQQGIWACCDPHCSGRTGTALEQAAWRFGAIYFERQRQCQHCEARVYELLFCNSCGEALLSGSLDAVDGVEILSPTFIPDGDGDDADDNDEDDDANEVVRDRERARKRLLLGVVDSGDAQARSFQPTTGRFVDGEPRCVHVAMAAHERGRNRCPNCRELDRTDSPRFRPARMGTQFYLGVNVPALLEHQSAPSGSNVPAGGRRVMTFTDSRQGSAQFALRSQITAERNFVRAYVYHDVWQSQAPVDPAALAKARETLEKLEAMGEDMASARDALRTKIAQMAGVAAIGWSAMQSRLAATTQVGTWMRTALSRAYLPAQLSASKYAEMCLHREFFRRPRRQNSLETLGLMSIAYPALQAVHEMPPSWRELGGDLDEWRTFLKILLDFQARALSAVPIDDELKRWLGVKIMGTSLVEQGGQTVRNRVYAWPSIGAQSRLPRLVRLLLRAFTLEHRLPDGKPDPAVVTTVNAVFADAWTRLHELQLLRRDGDTSRLHLADQASFVPVGAAWQCRITRRVLDVTLRGRSPYAPDRWEGAETEPVQMPSLRYPFGADRGSSVPELAREWRKSNPEVVAARTRGVWTEFSDRIAAYDDSLYFQSGEHSAQQSASTLKRLEKDFRSGRVNILSCSTTMEMGVDIGGLDAVAMNNAPPSPANYRQRAGRAGRTRSDRASVVTLCNSTPHGEAVFRSPIWPFATPMHVPSVSLTSERIVTRHVHAFLLGHYFRASSTRDGHRLTCCEFFTPAADVDTDSAFDRFTGWLEQQGGSATLASSIEQLVRRSALEGTPLAHHVSRALVAFNEAAAAWRDEHDALLEQLEDVGGRPVNQRSMTPVQRALNVQLIRLERDYLLRYLVSEGVLPGYGFPLHVVPFVTTTAEELKATQNLPPGEQRDEGFGSAKGYPSRHVALAVREYAPGASVVLNGMVYDSAGITLNWKRPASADEANEVQALGWAWRCGACGGAGVRRQFVEACPHCNESGSGLRRTHLLQPAGFAVDIRARPHNDLSQPVYLKPVEPWVSAGDATWRALPNVQAGRIRCSEDGKLVHRHGGVDGDGYAVCLVCGRAEPMDGREVPEVMRDHRRLRGGREESDTTARCPGSDTGFQQKEIFFGADSTTDVFELQLHRPHDGTPIDDKTVCTTIAVALRDAVAAHLGIDTRELGWSVARQRSRAGGTTRSIFIYDAAEGGAGYVGTIPLQLPLLFERAQKRLRCPRNCDTACHACLLAFDTQPYVEYLDRKKALEVLDVALLEALELPAELQFFGSGSQLEPRTITAAALAAVRSAGTKEVRVYLGGDAADWIWEDWPLRDAVVRWALDGLTVRVVVPAAVLADMPHDEARRLAVDLSAPSRNGGSLTIELIDQLPRAGAGYVLLEVSGQRSTRIAVTDPAALVPGPAWGSGTEGSLVRVEDTDPLPTIATRPAREAELFKPLPNHFQLVEVKGALDGNIDGFGERLWTWLEARLPGLKARRLANSPLAEVRYVDRYITRPLNARLVFETFRTLARSGATTATTRFVLETAKRSPGRPVNGSTVSTDWDNPTVQREVLTELLAAFSTPTLVMNEVATAPHARELSIRWVDGARLSVRPDLGLTIFDARGYQRFDFQAPAQAQARAICAVDYLIAERTASRATFYLRDVEGG